MLLLKFARLLPVLAVFTLLAACGGETIIDLGDVSETATEADASDTTSNTTEADPSETTSNSTEADASDTTSSSTEPTAVPATSAPEPTVATSESEEAIAPDQDATGSLDEDDVVVLRTATTRLPYSSARTSSSAMPNAWPTAHSQFLAHGTSSMQIQPQPRM